MCAIAHVSVLPPLRRRPPGAGRVAFCCGARLARVEAPAKGRMGLHPMPRFSRAKPAAAASNQPASLVVLGACAECRPYPRAAGVRRAPLSALLPSAAWTAQAGSRWGRLGRAGMRHAQNSAEGPVRCCVGGLLGRRCSSLTFCRVQAPHVRRHLIDCPITAIDTSAAVIAP